MSSSTVLQFCLVLHILGFTIMAGTVIADYAVQRRLGKYLLAEKGKSLSMLEGTNSFPMLISLGVLLLVSTGIGMVTIYKGAVTSMPWFRIKMILVLLVIINGAIFIKGGGVKLRELLAENTTQSNQMILSIRSRIVAFHGVQIALLITIFVLSVFRF